MNWRGQNIEFLRPAPAFIVDVCRPLPCLALRGAVGMEAKLLIVSIVVVASCSVFGEPSEFFANKTYTCFVE